MQSCRNEVVRPGAYLFQDHSKPKTYIKNQCKPVVHPLVRPPYPYFLLDYIKATLLSALTLNTDTGLCHHKRAVIPTDAELEQQRGKGRGRHSRSQHSILLTTLSLPVPGCTVTAAPVLHIPH